VQCCRAFAEQPPWQGASQHLGITVGTRRRCHGLRAATECLFAHAHRRIKKSLDAEVKALKPEDRVLIIGNSREPFDNFRESFGAHRLQRTMQRSTDESDWPRSVPKATFCCACSHAMCSTWRARIGSTDYSVSVGSVLGLGRGHEVLVAAQRSRALVAAPRLLIHAGTSSASPHLPPAGTVRHTRRVCQLDFALPLR
jgi:hypothetical protein